MTGLIVLLAVGAAAFGALVLLGVPRPIRVATAAALFLGAAGYASQGRPSLHASPASTRADRIEIAPEAIALRERLLGRFTADTSYLIASDAMTRVGDPRAAAQVVLGGVRGLPRSFTLWTYLGTTIAASDGTMSPAARLAFERAMRLAPEHPAPPYYAGLAYVGAGEFAKARPLWARAVALSPAGAGYRRDLAIRLALLDRYLALTDAAR